METKKLSDYMDKMFNMVYLHPKRTADTINANIADEAGELFGSVFPLPDHYTYAVDGQGFKVKQYSGRTEATQAKKNHQGMESHRDYLILDVEKFESFLTERTDDLKRRMPRGMKSTPTVGFADADVLSSLTTPEARLEYAKQIAAKVSSMTKGRTMSPEQKEAAAKRMKEYHAKNKKGDSKSKKA